MLKSLPCTAPAAQAGSEHYALAVLGTIPVGGGEITNDSGAWEKFGVTSGPAGSSIPGSLLAPLSLLPVTLPSQPIYIYSGTYTVNSTTAQTTGCFYVFTTVSGATIDGTTLPSTLAAGFPNESTAPLTIANATSGSFTTLSLSVTASGTGSGAFSLDSGDSGSITITGRVTAQSPTSLAVKRGNL